MIFTRTKFKEQEGNDNQREIEGSDDEREIEGNDDSLEIDKKYEANVLNNLEQIVLEDY